MLVLTAQAAELQWVEKSPSVLELRDGGRLVLAYNHGSGRACCYVHPLVSPGGVTLTDDDPADHPHHRGLFWGWPIVEVDGKRYDTWLQRGVVHWPSGPVLRDIHDGKARLMTRHSWYAGDRELFSDSILITTHPQANGARVLEVELMLAPSHQPITLAGAPEQNKGYGGLSIRYAPRSRTVLRSSEGPVLKDEDHGKHEWAELEGSFADGRAGLRVTANRINPGYPNPWCLRHYGFTGANFPGVPPRRSCDLPRVGAVRWRAESPWHRR